MNPRLLFALSGVIVASWFTACQKPMVASDIQGSWVALGASQQKWIKGTNTCRILLLGDGTFSASVPDYLMMTFDKASGQVISGRGQWSLEPKKKLAPVGIVLSFNEVDGSRKNWNVANTLQAESGRLGQVLFFYVGEEGGDRFVFERAVNQTSRPP